MGPPQGVRRPGRLDAAGALTSENDGGRDSVAGRKVFIPQHAADARVSVLQRLTACPSCGSDGLLPFHDVPDVPGGELLACRR